MNVFLIFYMKIFTYALLLVSIISCSAKHNHCASESFFIASYYDGTGGTEGKRLVNYDLCDSILESDTIDMYLFEGSHYGIENNFVSFNISNQYELIKIDRIVNVYPIIWSDNSPVMQYIKLRDLKYTAVRNLPLYRAEGFKRTIYEDAPDADLETVEEIETDYEVFLSSQNLIQYPEVKVGQFMKNKFKKITKNELRSALEIELNDSNNYSDVAALKTEKAIWLNYINKYNKGLFAKSNQMFNVEYGEVLIKLFLVKNGTEVEKILKFENTIGN